MNGLRQSLKRKIVSFTKVADIYHKRGWLFLAVTRGSRKTAQWETE